MSTPTKEPKDKKRRVKSTKAGSRSSSPDSKKSRASKTPLSEQGKTARSLFYQEESEAADRNAEEDLRLSHQAAAELKRVMLKMQNLKSEGSKASKEEEEELRIHGTLQFVTLKKLNRLAHFRCKKVRDVTNEAKQKIDSHHLKLQNLLYEVMHLQKEITKCLEFKSKDEDISLVDLDEFYQDAPETISRPVVTKKDPHQQTLARLEYELEQRKKLSGQYKESENSKEQLHDEIKTKKEYLESLQPKLSTILQATKPVQEYLGMPFDEVREQHMTASFLPRPLYVLYMQATAYRDACDKYLSASINGDVEVAKAMEGTSFDLDDDDDESDQEDSEKTTKKRRRRESTGDAMSSKRQKLLKKHPLSVDINVTCKDGSSLFLTFNYLVCLEIVTVTVRVEPSVGAQTSGIAGGDLLSPHSLLMCLYPDDYGTETPRASNKYALQKLGMGEFSQYINEVGHPYLWVQWLCGMQVLSVCEDDTPQVQGASSGAPRQPQVKAQVSLSAIHMEGTIKRLRRRMKARLALQKQLTSLEHGTVPVIAEYYNLFPAKINSRLTSWKRATYDDYKTSPYTQDLVAQSVGREHDLYFTGQLERGSACMHFLCVVSSDYPNTPPIFALQLKWKRSWAGSLEDNVRDIGAEINIHWPELLRGRSHEELLTNQMQRLLMCLDVYLETECESGGDKEGPVEFPREKTYTRSTLGPSRSKPYKFNSQLGYFSQR